MAVLNLNGSRVDWSKEQDPRRMVKWDRKDSSGREVKGSLRTIAHLDRTNERAKKRFGTNIVVIQPPFNTTVRASAGTHDFDCCIDVYIPGVDWWTQQRFFRSNGWGGWFRYPPKFGYHLHIFSLPEREGVSISDDFKVHGFKVGKYVDGGYSTYGYELTTSQVLDYYNHAFGLSGMHVAGSDKSWFPKNIEATIFPFKRYAAWQKRIAA